jgi:hypothetical protein
MKLPQLFVTVTLGIAVAGGCAPVQQQQAQPPQYPGPIDRMYAFNSAAQAGCPGMSWAVTLHPDGTLSGTITWNNEQSLARVTGRLDTRTGAFQMTANEIGGLGRSAIITGTVNPSDNWLVANVQAPNLTCQGIRVPWFVPSHT